MNRKIAVIVAGIDETYQSSILNGIETAASECNFDCYVFVSFTGMTDNISHDAGEMNIFKLPDFSSFDGAILLTNTIGYQPVVDDILERITKSGIPTVSIDNKVDGLLHIGIDNRSAMKKITEHFINVHKFKKFNYISGPKDNPESIDRLEAFLEVLDKYGLTIEDDRIYYGDFRGDSSKKAIDVFLENELDLPQAIICANDVMAVAAINRLHSKGFSVPDDIAVSGFDDVFDRYNLRVELTSVKRPLVYSGQLACEMLFNKFNDKPYKESNILEMSPKFSESCGCKKCTVIEALPYKKASIENYNKINKMNRYMSLFNKFACDVSAADNYKQYLNSLKKFTTRINPDEFYFCLNKNWDYQPEGFDMDFSDIPNIPENYEDDIVIPIAYHYGVFEDNTEIKLNQLLPYYADKTGKPKFYYIFPLHFRQRCLGYFAINNNPVSLHNTPFQSWCITINNSLENIRKINAMNCAVKKLKKLYIQDTFSGIYNRNGFVNATSDIFRECAENSRNIMLMFIDLDGLKDINDTYGHAVGDEAIRAISRILDNSCNNHEIYCRFGGDEFIVFAADYNDSNAQALTKSIQDKIAIYNQTSGNEYCLSASTGYVIAVPKVGDDLFLFVTEADKKMYETKREKKSKYLRSLN